MLSLKNEIHKKNKDYHNLKVAYFKLDEENKKNVKIIEKIIIECGRNMKCAELNKMNSEEYDNEIKNILSIGMPTERTLLQLKEVILKLIKL